MNFSTHPIREPSKVIPSTRTHRLDMNIRGRMGVVGHILSRGALSFEEWKEIDNQAHKLYQIQSRNQNMQSMTSVRLRDLAHVLANIPIGMILENEQRTPIERIAYLEMKFRKRLEEIVKFYGESPTTESGLSRGIQSIVGDCIPMSYGILISHRLQEDTQISGDAAYIIQSIVAEIIRNYEKYGKDGRISLSEIEFEGKMCLRIVFENEKKEVMPGTHSSKLGTSIMRDSAKLLGGTIDIHNGETYSITIDLPLSKIGKIE